MWSAYRVSQDNHQKTKPLKFKLRQLEAFRAVSETGSVTKAAERLEVSQPAVSRLLSDFSASVGFELFTRSRGGLEPTSDSRYLLAEVRRILENLDHLEDLRRDLTERKRGHIRIACLPGFATSHLPGVLVRFLNERPGVTVSLEPDRPERILEWIIGEQYEYQIETTGGQLDQIQLYDANYEMSSTETTCNEYTFQVIIKTNHYFCS